MLHICIRRILLETQGNRKHSHKMVFLAGSPGAGKSTLVDMLGLDSMFTTCNIDHFFEKMMKDEGMNLNMAQTYKDVKDLKNQKEESETWSERQEQDLQNKRAVRSREGKLFSDAIKQFTQQKGELCNIGANFIVDGTASSVKRITQEKEFYEQLGYDTAMIKIEVPVDISVQRNQSRGAQGKRQLPDFIVKGSAEKTNKPENVEAFRKAFGKNFFYVSNVGSYEDFQESIEAIQLELERFLQS